VSLVKATLRSRVPCAKDCGASSGSAAPTTLAMLLMAIPLLRVCLANSLRPGVSVLPVGCGPCSAQDAAGCAAA
jgi:hypothetical protein